MAGRRIHEVKTVFQGFGSQDQHIHVVRDLPSGEEMPEGAVEVSDSIPEGTIILDHAEQGKKKKES